MNKEKGKVWLNILLNLFLNFPSILEYKKCSFLSDRQTLLYLLETRKGIVRFGDGEIGYISRYSYNHQKQVLALRNKLKEILSNYNEKSPYIIGLPVEILFGKFIERKLPKRGWQSARYSLYPYINKNNCYGSAFCFRILTVVDENKKEYAKLILQLFQGKDIVYVGGIEPYPNLIEIKEFIQTPPQNAFDEYDNLLRLIEKKAKLLKNPVVVLSCGITATALSAEVNNLGIPAYDVGLCFTKRLYAYLFKNSY